MQCSLLKNPKLNLRKFRRLSPSFGIDTKYMIGSRIKFQIMHTTKAFVNVTSRIEDPMAAIFVASSILLYLDAKTQAENSSPARDVSKIQDHPV
jgi:hypothetical protein